MGNVASKRRSSRPTKQKTSLLAPDTTSPAPNQQCKPSLEQQTKKHGEPEAFKHGRADADIADIKPPADDTTSVVQAKDAKVLFPIVDPADAPRLGLPYEVYELGPPTPPCDEARIQTRRALNDLKPPSEGEIDNILQLICNIMDAPAALVALFDDKEIFCRNSVGFKKGDFPWRWSFCAWTLQPPAHQTFIVEDTDQDVRFKDNQAARALGVKFYCGSPLVASNGHRLGSLCFVDSKPRTMDACRAQILNNFSELVVRELEKDIELQLQTQQHDSLKKVYGQLQRTIDCFHNAVLFVDTSAKPWTILHCNLAWTQMSGLSREDTLLLHLWELFLDDHSHAVHWQEFCPEIAANSEFKATGLHLRIGLNEKPLTLSFRPAGKETLDTNSIPIGVPSFAAHNKKSPLYFVTITEEDASSSSVPSTVNSSCRSSCQSLDGLEMGALLGSGVHGRVYFGTWYGTSVAIKVIEETGSAEAKAVVDAHKASVEAALSAQLAHPNVVRTLFYHTLLEARKSGDNTSGSFGDSAWDSGSNAMEMALNLDLSDDTPTARGGSTTWVVMEFCDRGTLQDAVDKGWLRSEVSKDAPSNMEAVLVTAREVASAMAYLHDRGIVHGDLSAYNVLLSSSGSNVRDGGRGFMAKVADFGLSHRMDVQSKLMTHSYGTVTHMPPELLVHGSLSKATDVYSFGVLMWEMATGSRAWGGLSHGQVIQIVASGEQSLTFPPGGHEAFEELALSCMNRDPDQRPAFAEITSDLQGMLDAMGSPSHSDSDSQPDGDNNHVMSNSGFFQSL